MSDLSNVLGAIKEGNLGAVGTQIVAGGDRLIPMGGLANEIRRIEDPIAREVDKVRVACTSASSTACRRSARSRMASARAAGRYDRPPIEQPRDILSTIFRGTAPRR